MDFTPMTVEQVNDFNRQQRQETLRQYQALTERKKVALVEPLNWLINHQDARIESIDNQVELVFLRVCETCRSSLRTCHCGGMEVSERLIFNRGIGLNQPLIDVLNASAAPKTEPPAPTEEQVAEAVAETAADSAVDSAPDVLPKVPLLLKSLPNWVTWKLIKDEAGEYSKEPFIAGTDRHASSTNPSTWSTFDAVKNSTISSTQGIGFASTQGLQN